MKKFLLMSVLTLLCVSCAEKSYFIDGNSTQFSLNGGMAYIREFSSVTTKQSIDSCEVLHGHFQMSGPLDSTMLVSLSMGDDAFIPVVLENGDISIDIANTSIKIAGTPLNEKLYAFLASRDSLVYLITDIPRSQAYLFMQGFSPFEIQDELFKKQSEYTNALDKLETEFIKDNYDNVLGVTWFMDLCRRTQMHYGIPVMTPQIKGIYDSAPKKFRKDYRVASYIDAIRSY